MLGPAVHRGGPEGGVDRPGARTRVRRSSRRTGRPAPRPSSAPVDAPARRSHRGNRRALHPTSGGNRAAEMFGCRADGRDGLHERFVPNRSHQLQSLSLPNGKVERSHRVDDQEFYQLLDKDGISDDVHLFNTKLREWEDYYNPTTERPQYRATRGPVSLASVVRTQRIDRRGDGSWRRGALSVSHRGQQPGA
jgi:hypothetical protein